LIAAIDPYKAALVKLRFFAGLTIPQAAQTLGISHATVFDVPRSNRADGFSHPPLVQVVRTGFGVGGKGRKRGISFLSKRALKTDLRGIRLI
jgi:ECF sigma factor